MPSDQRHVTGIGLNQGGIVQDQDPVIALDERLAIFPEDLGIGFEPGEQVCCIRRGNYCVALSFSE